MHTEKFTIILMVIAVLLVPIGAAQPAVLGVWRDINPTAYINPPANPPLNSVYMLSANEGWAVGHYSISYAQQGAPQAVPAVLHYDSFTWNLVSVPKNPTDPDITAGYVLTSVSFGPPNHPINRNDGWTVGYGFDLAAACGAGTPLTCGVALHWDGVTWRTQLSGLSGSDAGPMFSAFMVSSTDVWAVGQDTTGGFGVFWHWTGIPGLGGGWNIPQTHVTCPGVNVPNCGLFSIYMVSPTDGWAVGAGGLIYHYFGGSWNQVNSPVTTALRSVFMLSPTDGWAVGDGGVIIHYSAGTWSGPVSPGTTATNTLRSIFMVTSTEGWAGGDTGTLIHFSGGSWTAVPTNQIPTLPTTAFSFNSVYYNTAGDGWVVGTNGVILHFDGSNWGTVTSSTLTELTSISFGPPLAGTLNPNDGWAVGRATSSILAFSGVTEPTIVHWNGFMWTKGVALGTANDLFSVFMVSTGDVWTVGGGSATTATCSATPCPVILHFTGGSWNTVTPPSGSYILNSIFMVSSTEGWAVGIQGTTAPFSGIILHYIVSGGVGAWSVFPAPSGAAVLPRLRSVFMLGPNEGWAVGDSALLLHYTVSGGVGTWNVVTVNGLTTKANLNSIFMFSPTKGWVVGGYPRVSPTPEGPVIIYWDGMHWTNIATPTVAGPLGSLALPPILKSIYCTGTNDCWAVGDVDQTQIVATIFHWDGITWTHITLAPALLGQPVIPPNLNSVFMLSPTSGWIVGSPPLPPIVPPTQEPLSTILRFASFGGMLTTTTTSTSLTVSTVTMSSFISSSTPSTSFTSTTMATSSTVTPRIPGFPWESIIAGICIGLVALGIVRQRRLRRQRS